MVAFVRQALQHLVQNAGVCGWRRMSAIIFQGAKISVRLNYSDFSEYYEIQENDTTVSKKHSAFVVESMAPLFACTAEHSL